KLPDNATSMDVEELVWEQLRTVYDPEIPINVVDLGLIYRCDFDHTDPENRTVEIDMTLTAPGCGMGDILVDAARAKLAIVPTINTINVELVLDPPWSMEMMSDAAKLQVGML